jgi:glycosyltransferase involved in cell wall biosynthesis
MTLALVIPVYNDANGLHALLKQVARSGVFDQIVVVDDGSDQVVSVPESIQLIRHEISRGAGVARNSGLDQVQCDHVIFFDSDDLFTADFVALCHELRAAEQFDFCIFRHNDSRISGAGRWGQLALDNALWRQANTQAHGTLWAVNETDALVRTANYPWNKVYRTQFLRDHGLRFSHDIVHNDITMHWLGFAAAQRILASDRICAHHVVQSGGSRLTNEAGRSRLGVFRPLEIVVQGVCNDAKLWQAFLKFTASLLDWVRDTMDPVLHPELDQATGAFWRTHLDKQTLDCVIKDDPVLALRLVLQMAGGRVPC